MGISLFSVGILICASGAGSFPLWAWPFLLIIDAVASHIDKRILVRQAYRGACLALAAMELRKSKKGGQR